MPQSKKAEVATRLERALEAWFDALRRYKAGMPARGTVAAALVILERLQSDFVLDLAHHRAAGGAQLQGLGGHAAAEILARFGETRPFLAEGGRTNRGGPAEIQALLDALRTCGLEDLSERERNDLLHQVGQTFLVRKVQEFHSRERVRFEYDERLTTAVLIDGLLKEARAQGKQGEIAQHLVGAKLQLRFPALAISNEMASTADMPTGRSGDFAVGDSAFHVTVAPQPAVIQRCAANLRDGLRPYLLVPLARVEAARQLADLQESGSIAVEAIESFVAQNLDELAGFSAEARRMQLVALLLLYNERVDRAEVDKSLLIELPPQLQRLSGEARSALASAGLMQDV